MALFYSTKKALWKKVILAVSLMLGASFTQGIGLLLLLPLLQLVGLNVQQQTSAGITTYVSSFFTTVGLPITLVLVLCVYVIISILYALFTRWQTMASFAIAVQFESFLRQWLYRAVINVSKLPEGKETILGDRGVRLSGGERQRLALARALLRKPTLLLLDEATSNLDSENEQRIQDAIDALRGRGDMTIVVIAHRLSTIRKADVIYVLDNGRIVECGDWEQLMLKEDGHFRDLWNRQVAS